jgi:hypothetical protein
MQGNTAAPEEPQPNVHKNAFQVKNADIHAHPFTMLPVNLEIRATERSKEKSKTVKLYLFMTLAIEKETDMNSVLVMAGMVEKSTSIVGNRQEILQ